MTTNDNDNDNVFERRTREYKIGFTAEHGALDGWDDEPANHLFQTSEILDGLRPDLDPVKPTTQDMEAEKIAMAAARLAAIKEVQAEHITLAAPPPKMESEEDYRVGPTEPHMEVIVDPTARPDALTRLRSKPVSLSQMRRIQAWENRMSRVQCHASLDEVEVSKEEGRRIEERARRLFGGTQRAGVPPWLVVVMCAALLLAVALGAVIGRVMF